MRVQHSFKNLQFVSEYTNGAYQCLIDNTPVVGTAAKSRGESCMLMTEMFTEMLDREFMTPQPGDILTLDDGTMHIIDNMEVLVRDEVTGDELLHVHLRENIDGPNFRGPASAMSEDQTPRVSLSGGPFLTRRRTLEYEWMGTVSVAFWAWRELPTANGGFVYRRDVNVWQEGSVTV